MRSVKFLDGHFKTSPEQLGGLIKIAILLTENALSKMNDPVYGMVIAQTGEYLYSFCHILTRRLKIIEKHEVFGIIAIAHSVVDVVLPHLLLSQRYGFLEKLQELFLTCACIYLSYLLIDRRQ